MKNKIGLIGILLITLLACETETPLSVSAENFSEENISNCNNAKCPEITVNYVLVEGEQSISEKINNELKSFIIASLQIGEKETNAQTIEEAAENFIKTYKMHSAEFPDMAAEYFSEINVSDIFKNDQLLSFQLKQYKFTGGAHGYGTTHFVNFDPATGEKLSIKDMFSDFDAFKKVAEKKFRKAHKISENENINSTGFWFEDDTFYLPETVGFTNKEVLFHYNQYDIASYAEGPIELAIPIKDIQQFLAISVK